MVTNDKGNKVLPRNGRLLLWDKVVLSVVLDLHGEVLVVRGLQDGFCGNLPAAFPMPDRANPIQVQDGHTAGQGRAKQRQWKHHCDNTF